MAKLTLTDLSTLENSAIVPVNANSAAIEIAMENTVSRDGTSPNHMLADLDMNSNRVLNLPDAVTDQEPATFGQLTDVQEELQDAIDAIDTSGGGGGGSATLADGDKGDITVSGSGTVWTIDASYQPLDSDLTSIAALTTTTYGRSLLTLTDADDLAAETRQLLTGDTTYYVRTVPVTTSISNATPAVATATSHGLLADDRVVFSKPLDRGSCTITLASPGVFTKTAHGFSANDPIVFSTSGASPGVAGTLPTGITAGVTYFVNAINANTFKIAATSGGADINTSVSQAGTHYVERASTLPTGVTEGTAYYVISTGLTANAFQFSSSQGGAAINTTGPQIGKVACQTGSDSNLGLTQTRTGAFLTLAAAYNYIAKNLDFGAHTVTIQLADGTYYNAGAHILNTGDVQYMYKAALVGGTLIIQGNLANQDQVVLRSASFEKNLSLRGQFPGVVYVSNMRFDRPDTTEACLLIDCDNSEVQLQNLTYVKGFEKVFVAGSGTSVVFPVPVFGTGKHYLIGDAGSSFITFVGGAAVYLNYNSDYVAVGTSSYADGFLVGCNNSGSPPSMLVQDGINFFGHVTGLAFNLQGQATLQENTFTSTGGLVSQDGIPAIVSLTPGTVATGNSTYPGGGYYNNFNLLTTQGKNNIPGAVVDTAFTYSVPVNGFSMVIGDYIGNVILNPAGTLATGTITMPVNPENGHQIKVRTTQEITALTVSPSAGQSVLGHPSTLAAGGSLSAIYRTANTTWFFGQ